VNKKQKGFSVIEVLISVVCISLVGFVCWYVYRSTNIADKAYDNAEKSISITTAAPTSANAKQQETASTVPPGSAPTTITFNKGGGSLEGETVKVSATTTDPQTGTCTYKFTLGNSKVQKTNSIVNSRTCSIGVPLSEFPKNGNWYFELSFVSKDGKVTGKGGGITITINPQPRTISFIKGGGGQSGDVVSVSGTLSENQSGTCTYRFSLNGTVRVEKTTSISGLQTCSINIPVSEFPKSATYSFSLSFVSSSGLVTASQPPYDITVN
jgi:Tfp pilus assembly protein PilV